MIDEAASTFSKMIRILHPSIKSDFVATYKGCEERSSYIISRAFCTDCLWVKEFVPDIYNEVECCNCHGIRMDGWCHYKAINDERLRA